MAGKFGQVPGDLRATGAHLADHEEVHINVAGAAMERMSAPLSAAGEQR